VSADLIDRAGVGDDQAFGKFVAPYRRELQAHCYRVRARLLNQSPELSNC
jgi:hypothetical protein